MTVRLTVRVEVDGQFNVAGQPLVHEETFENSSFGGNPIFVAGDFDKLMDAARAHIGDVLRLKFGEKNV